MTVSMTREQGLELLRQMLRIRRFEERAAELYQLGKIHGFLHLYIGEEAVAVGSVPALTNDEAIVATYREHGHALVRGTSMRSLMAELFGKATGCAGGRGGSMHFSMPHAASTAGWRSSAAACRWRWGWHSPTSYKVVPESQPAISETAPWRKANFTNP